MIMNAFLLLRCFDAPFHLLLTLFGSLSTSVYLLYWTLTIHILLFCKGFVSSTSCLWREEPLRRQSVPYWVVKLGVEIILKLICNIWCLITCVGLFPSILKILFGGICHCVSLPYLDIYIVAVWLINLTLGVSSFGHSDINDITVLMNLLSYISNDLLVFPCLRCHPCWTSAILIILYLFWLIHSVSLWLLFSLTSSFLGVCLRCDELLRLWVPYIKMLCLLLLRWW